MGPVFEKTDLSASDFKETFEAEVTANYQGAWTLLAGTKRGFEPVGFLFGFWPHASSHLGPFMIVGDIVWVPKVSARVKVSSAVNFFAKIRNEIQMVEYAEEKNKKFFETIAKHGVMRRVGTSFVVYRDEPAAVFETRRGT